MNGKGKNKPRGQATIPDDYVGEKSEHIVSWLAHIVDLTNSTKGLPDKFVERLYDYLHPALDDAVRLWSYACDGDSSPEDHDLIARNGYKGYEEIAVKYGLLDMTSQAKEEARLVEFVGRLRELLAGDRVPNRTIIHELLRDCDIQHPAVEAIANLTEKVTNSSDLPWQTYVLLASQQLDRFMEDAGVSLEGR